MTCDSKINLFKNGQSRETENIGYTRRRKTKQKAQHNMCWTAPYIRHKPNTNKKNKKTQPNMQKKSMHTFSDYRKTLVVLVCCCSFEISTSSHIRNVY